MDEYDFSFYFSIGITVFLVIAILIDKFFFKSYIANISYKSMKFLVAILTVIGIVLYVYLKLMIFG